MRIQKINGATPRFGIHVEIAEDLGVLGQKTVNNAQAVARELSRDNGYTYVHMGPELTLVSLPYSDASKSRSMKVPTGKVVISAMMLRQEKPTYLDEAERSLGMEEYPKVFTRSFSRKKLSKAAWKAINALYANV